MENKFISNIIYHYYINTYIINKIMTEHKIHIGN